MVSVTLSHCSSSQVFECPHSKGESVVFQMQMTCWVVPWGVGSLCCVMHLWSGGFVASWAFQHFIHCCALVWVFLDLICTGMQRFVEDPPAMFGMAVVFCLLLFSYWLSLDLAGSRWPTTSLIGHLQRSPDIPPGSLTTQNNTLTRVT